MTERLAAVGQATHQPIAGHLHPLDHRHQDQHCAKHDFIIKPLIAVADGEVAESTAADHTAMEEKPISITMVSVIPASSVGRASGSRDLKLTCQTLPPIDRMASILP